MRVTRPVLIAVLVAVSMVALPLSAAGGLAASDATAGSGDAFGPNAAALDSGPAEPTPVDSFAGHLAGPSETAALAQADEDEDPTTEDTIGYVEGYWYDDELPVDDRDDATLAEDELEAVVYRTMARVEVIRGLTFQEDVPVEVITREEFQEEQELFGEVSEEEELYENVRLEALFTVDRETDAFDEWETVYGDSVAGFYQPATGEIVLVSDSVDEPEVDEEILAHELLHALQDQHFDLSSYDRDTQDRDRATDGLIEGDAVWVDEAYGERCDDDWACTVPTADQPVPPSDFNWGLYFAFFQPYDDGPDYIDHLYESGGQDAVDAAYDDPPTTTSEVIRPGDEREPRPIEIEDRSSDAWEQYEVDGETASDTMGEATMVAMFADGALSDGEPSVIDAEAFIDAGPLGTVEGFDYDQPYTDGWAGDEFVVYVGDEESVEESGYVWQTEWTSEADAEEFLEGYLTLLANHGAQPVEDHRNTFAIDDGYPGAYAIDHEGETVTIVRAPSVDELSEIEEGAAPEGEDTMAIENGEGVVSDDETGADETGNGTDADDTDDETGADETGNETITNEADDTIPGFGVGTALVGLVLLFFVTRSRV